MTNYPFTNCTKSDGLSTGVRLFHEGRIKEAQLILQVFVSTNRESALAFFYLGLIFRELGEDNNAIRMFENAKSLSPGNAKYDLFIASCLTNLKQISKALRIWESLVNHPDPDIGWSACIALNYHQGHPQKSLDGIEKLAQHNGEHVLYSHNEYLVPSLIALKRFEEAKAACSQILKSVNDKGSYLYLLALSEEYTGDRNQAIEHYYEALKFSPNDENILKRLARLEILRLNLKSFIKMILSIQRIHK